MNYSYACRGVLATLALAGCSIDNPLFGVSSDSADSAGVSTGEGSTGVAPTSDSLTSTSDPGTSVSDPSASETGVVDTSATETSAPGTSQTATSVEPETGTTDMVEPGTSTGDPMACGNGSVDVGEECDDGNTNPGDGCSAECLTEQDGCGDGVVGANEQCDDGGGNGPGKACLGTCQKNICGDGDQGPGEECDDGDKNADEGSCSTMCAKAFCGDGFVNGLEKCDDGEDNGKLPGKCNEDCSQVVSVNTLLIKVVPMVPGDLSFGGIAGGDQACEKKVGVGYKILAVDGVDRIASLGPNDGVGQGNTWVLHAHRGYVNEMNQLIFVTGKERLLGVRKKVPVPLLAPIGVGNQPQLVWTGLNSSWQSADDCKDWVSADAGSSGAVGNTISKDSTFLSSGAVKPCSSSLAIYCVQYP